MDDEIKRETTAMKEDLADAITAWSALEDSLAMTLDAALSTTPPPKDDPRNMYGIKLYFTPVATEVRLNLVNAAVQMRCEEIHHREHLLGQQVHPYGQVLTETWSRLRQKLDRARKLRNTFAHSSIIDYRRNDGKFTVRLTATFFETFTKQRDKQLPGLSRRFLPLRHSSNLVRRIAGRHISLTCLRFSLMSEYRGTVLAAREGSV